RWCCRMSVLHGRLGDMCGRYVLRQDPAALADQLGIVQPMLGETLADYQPDYNVAPTKPVLAALERKHKDGTVDDRRLREVRWGLIPSWAKDRSIGSKMFNARIETVAEKPSFRNAFKARR